MDDSTTGDSAHHCYTIPQEDAAATSDGAGEGLQEATAERYGRLRLSNVADVVGGKLDPAAYLRKGRHAEWTEAMRGVTTETLNIP